MLTGQDDGGNPPFPECFQWNLAAAHRLAAFTSGSFRFSLVLKLISGDTL